MLRMIPSAMSPVYRMDIGVRGAADVRIFRDRANGVKRETKVVGVGGEVGRGQRDMPGKMLPQMTMESFSRILRKRSDDRLREGYRPKERSTTTRIPVQDSVHRIRREIVRKRSRASQNTNRRSQRDAVTQIFQSTDSLMEEPQRSKLNLMDLRVILDSSCEDLELPEQNL